MTAARSALATASRRVWTGAEAPGAPVAPIGAEAEAGAEAAFWPEGRRSASGQLLQPYLLQGYWVSSCFDGGRN